MLSQPRRLVASAANDPTVLLADEPTANLDSGRGREVGRLLRRLADEDGRSIIIVSHDDRLRQVAHRTLWLEDGSFHQLDAMADDPVCHMPVDANTGYRVQVDSQEWWFCSEACRQEFTKRHDLSRP